MATISLALTKDLIPEEEEDKPVAGPTVTTSGPSSLPALILGAGQFSNQYLTDNTLSSSGPVRLIRLALRYGIKAFDTSIYYGPSEIVLGNALQLIRDEFPRSSYLLMTKCGRNGPNSFDYSPVAIRASVEKSLKRLQTPYLDTVYLHDTEFVADAYMPRKDGQHLSALTDEAEQYGLARGDEATVRGEGDRQVLAAFSELRKLKEEGLVRNIGITGFPLPTLLRLAILIRHTSPYQPADFVMSYGHLSLQNSTFAAFALDFRDRANVRQLLTASPFSMGLLTGGNPPPWHPATPELKAAVKTLKGLPHLALEYGVRKAVEEDMPLVVGFSSLHEIHECVEKWREVKQTGQVRKNSVEEEEAAIEHLKSSGYLDWSWASP